jgi:hypothetical protein
LSCPDGCGEPVSPAMSGGSKLTEPARLAAMVLLLMNSLRFIVVSINVVSVRRSLFLEEQRRKLNQARPRDPPRARQVRLQKNRALLRRRENSKGLTPILGRCVFLNGAEIDYLHNVFSTAELSQFDCLPARLRPRDEIFLGRYFRYSRVKITKGPFGHKYAFTLTKCLRAIQRKNPPRIWSKSVRLGRCRAAALVFMRVGGACPVLPVACNGCISNWRFHISKQGDSGVRRFWCR